MYLVDTNVLSEMRKQSRADPQVSSWYANTDADRMFVSPVILAEMETGVLSMERRDGVQGAMLRAWAETVFTAFQDRCIPIEQNISRIFAHLQVPDRRPERDAWIAATAIHANLTVVTRNEADFLVMGVPILNPWKWQD